MADTIGKYTVALEAQISKYVAELEKAQKKTDAFHGRVSKTISNINKAFVALGGAYAVTKTVAFIQRQVETADAIGEVAAAAGIGAEQLQELQSAFGKLTQASQGQINKGLQTFNANLGKARSGSDELAEAFAQVGVTLDTSGGPALEKTIEALGKIENAADRSALSGKLFGDRFGPQVAASVATGTKAINDLREAARQSGEVLDQEFLNAADELSNKFDQLNRVWTVASAEIVLRNADAIGKLADAVIRFGGWLASGGETVTRWAEAFGRAMAAISLNENVFDAVANKGPRQPPKISPTVSVPGGPDMLRVDKEIEKALLVSQQYGDTLSKQRERAAEDAQKYADAELKAQMQMLDDLHRFQDDRETAMHEAIKRQAQIRDAEMEGAEKIRQQQLEATEAFAEQAARNIQSYFAEFLFDPFEDGLKGMLMGFIDVLRRMAAEAAAAKILEAIGGSGGWIGAVAGFISGKRADGGPVAGGRAYLVGERGPELFVPGASGAILPNAGGVTINQTIDARGASDPAQTMRAMKIAKDQAKAEMMDLMRRGKFA